MNKEDFTKYEVARILGARALQLAMDAPLLVDLSKEELEKLNYDPIKIAEVEFESEVLPITVKRPLPKKTKEKIKKDTGGEKEEKIEIAEETKKEEIKTEKKKEKAEENKEEEVEKKEEEEIKEEGEIMELANPDDEAEDLGEEGEEE